MTELQVFMGFMRHIHGPSMSPMAGGGLCDEVVSHCRELYLMMRIKAWTHAMYGYTQHVNRTRPMQPMMNILRILNTQTVHTKY